MVSSTITQSLEPCRITISIYWFWYAIFGMFILICWFWYAIFGMFTFFLPLKVSFVLCFFTGFSSSLYFFSANNHSLFMSPDHISPNFAHSHG